jgi:GT2 family glycosyltransferase
MVSGASHVATEPVRADPVASVIVPVRDDQRRLEELTDALSAQTVGAERFEVVVADDGSKDKPAGAPLGPRNWIRVTSAPPSTSYAARNRAAALAEAPTLAFCDVDCKPEPTWLEAGLATLETSDLAAGVIRFLPPRRATVWAFLDMDTFLDQERAVRRGRAVTANLFVRRDLFESLGGFDGTLANNGDFEFVTRAVRTGAKLRLAPDAVVWHPVREDARSFLRKAWAVNARYAVREARAGRQPEGLKLRSWVPVVQTLRARRRTGKPIGLDARRVTTDTTKADVWANLRALPLIYLVLPYLHNVAQVAGWREGRRWEC